MKKRKNRKKLGRLLDCLSRKKADNSKNQKNIYCKSNEEICAFSKSMSKVVKHTQNWISR